MSIESIAATAAALSVVAATATGALVRIHRWYARLEHVVDLVEERSRQLLPNGGSSLADSINGIKTLLDLHSAALASLSKRVDETAASVPKAGDQS